MVAVTAIVVLGSAIGTRGLRRQLTAERRYEQAIAAYMNQQPQRSLELFEDVAEEFSDLPVGALCQLKVAFLLYADHGNLQQAESLFRAYLDTHPKTVFFVADSPVAEYEGELELIAYYFLGRIAQDRGNLTQARRWFDKIVNAGSRNPGNYIVSEAKSAVREMASEG